MKNTIIKPLLLVLFLTAAQASAVAQGTIAFTTYNPDTSKGLIWLSLGLDQGFVLPDSTYVGQLWWSDTSQGIYTSVGTPQTFSSGTNGYIFDGILTIPGHDAGAAVWYEVFCWNAAAGADWNTAINSPLLTAYGITPRVSVLLGGMDTDGNFFPTPLANGFASSVPEPTTITLAGLGLASLLICRRRKQESQLLSRGTARRI